MAQLCDQSLPHQTQHHRCGPSPTHLMSRRVVWQIMSQNNCLLVSINADHEVSLRIIEQRFTLAPGTDCDELFQTRRLASWPSSGHKPTWVAGRQLVDSS